MKGKSFHRWLNWVLLALLLGCAFWMVYETRSGEHAHYGLYRNTPRETIVIRPGGAVLAYYAFLVTLSLIPAVWLFRLAVDHRRSGALWAGAASIMVSATIAGFAYETLQTEIRLTLSDLGYRAGGQTVLMSWNEIQVMAVRMRSRSQWIELQGPDDLLVRIDLAPFTLPDKQLLVKELPRIARLSAVPRRLPDGWVWRRSGGIQIPE